MTTPKYPGVSLYLKDIDKCVEGLDRLNEILLAFGNDWSDVLLDSKKYLIA